MFSFADKPQELKVLFEHSFRLYRQTFAKVWYIITLVMVVASAQRYIPVFISQASVGEQGQSVAGASGSIHFSFINLVLLILLMFVSTFFMTTIIHRIYNLVQNPQANLQESLNVAKTKIITVFAAMLLITAIIGAGIMLFVIPGIILAFLLMFYLPNILFNNDKVFDAIANSFKLVGNLSDFGRTVAILLPAIFIMLITNFLLTLIMGKTNIFGQALGEIIIATFIMPYFNSIILVQYNDLRLRHHLRGLNSLIPIKAGQFSPPQ